tara:strand:- start:381 stop:638 length:258 start_codon:yes stop_codon:yes gene_type:complete
MTDDVASDDSNESTESTEPTVEEQLAGKADLSILQGFAGEVSGTIEKLHLRLKVLETRSEYEGNDFITRLVEAIKKMMQEELGKE